MRLKAKQRLRTQKDFAQVRQHGTKIHAGAFILVFWEKEGSPDLRRIGIVASRKVGNAVKRNRAKRLFREIFRLNQEALPPTGDFVIIVRSHFDGYSFESLQDRFLKTCKKAQGTL
tara:strand:- start:3235 stop:3582 length:348 start_codon:yes stop_codon:yes gene_type:complete